MPAAAAAAAAAASRYPSAVQSPRRPPSTLTPLLSPLSVAQGNDTIRLHYDLRTLPLNVRLSARDPPTQRAPERYLPRSDVRHLMLKNAFHPSLGVCPTSFSRRTAPHPLLFTVHLGRIQPLFLGNPSPGPSQRSHPHRYATKETKHLFLSLTDFYAQMTSSPPSTPHSTSKSPIENGSSSHRPSSSASRRCGKMRSPSPTLVPLHLRSSARRHRGTPDSSRPLRPPSLAANPSTDGTPTKLAFSLLDRPKEALWNKEKKKQTTRSLYCGSATAQRVYCESTGCVERLGGAGSSGTMKLHDAVAYQEKDGNEHGVWCSSE